MQLSQIARDQIARREDQYAQNYANYHRGRIQSIDPADVAPIAEMTVRLVLWVLLLPLSGAATIADTAKMLWRNRP
jgi:hypothetical protein